MLDIGTTVMYNNELYVVCKNGKDSDACYIGNENTCLFIINKSSNFQIIEGLDIDLEKTLEFNSIFIKEFDLYFKKFLPYTYYTIKNGIGIAYEQDVKSIVYINYEMYLTDKLYKKIVHEEIDRTCII